MTQTLFINARLIDPVAQTDSLGALLIEDGLIVQVYEEAAPKVKGALVVNCAGNCLAPGIVDIGVKVSEPGERHKESFRSDTPRYHACD
jgi:dihydroorotase